MKKIILSATAALALALMTSPAMAQTGYVGGSYVNTSVDTGVGNVDDDGWAVDGSVALDTGSSLGVTLNGGFADSDASDGVYSIAGHLYGKGADSLFGGFAAVGGNNDDTAWSVGAEGQLNMMNVSLAAALGYANNDDADTDAWGVDGRITVFPSENLALRGAVGWQNVDFGVGDDSAWSAGVGLEWQMDSAPVSFLADYTHSSFDDANVDIDAFRIGVRWNFGGPTLKARNDSGADFATLSSAAGVLTSF
jgi:hypothetical protein